MAHAGTFTPCSCKELFFLKYNMSEATFQHAMLMLQITTHAQCTVCVRGVFWQAWGLEYAREFNMLRILALKINQVSSSH